MEGFSSFVTRINGVVWGPAMILLLVGTGVYLTLRLRFIQVRYLRHAIEAVSGRHDKAGDTGELSHFQALSAALSATVGTGNIAGVATAIALGGPGAVFWMWVTAIVGMATKFTSCALAVKYRVTHEDGSTSGGPMYYLAAGLGQRWLAVLFALFAGVASFGIGCAVQSNSVVDGLLEILPAGLQTATVPPAAPLIGGTLVIKPIIGLILAVLVGIVILGGIRRIATVASRIVPVMCAFYIAGALAILIRFAPEVPGAFGQIFYYAFNPIAAGAGFLGFVVQQTIQKGVARGIFSNESGLGSAPIAYGAVRSSEPTRSGLVAMLGPFIDTLIMCTMTALVIIVTGAWQVQSADGELLYGPGGKGVPVLIDGVQVVGLPGEDGIPLRDADGALYPVPTGAALTSTAFTAGLGHYGGWVVSLGIVLFAYSTMISWSYYGDRSWEFLLGERAVKPYRFVFCVFVVIGTVSGLDLVWTIADTLNALMAVPNLIALLGLGGVIVRETRNYERKLRKP
ncbi:MAG: alanine/glycine:cation symporter family protein [Candidatus Hydrogenedentota bacterium]